MSQENHPSSKGLSRFFTASLIDKWLELYGYDNSVTPEQLLHNEKTQYLFIRAIGLEVFSNRRVYTRISLWANFFTDERLPTLDGSDDIILRCARNIENGTTTYSLQKVIKDEIAA